MNSVVIVEGLDVIGRGGPEVVLRAASRSQIVVAAVVLRDLWTKTSFCTFGHLTFVG